MTLVHSSIISGNQNVFYLSYLSIIFPSYVFYKNKLIIEVFITGILSGLVSITGELLSVTDKCSSQEFSLVLLV